MQISVFYFSLLIKKLCILQNYDDIIADDSWKKLSGSWCSSAKGFLGCRSCRMDVLTVSFLQTIYLKVDWSTTGTRIFIGCIQLERNSAFSFAVSLPPAHEKACESGSSVYFFWMLQTINGLCKLPVIRKPTFLIQNSKKKCWTHPDIRKPKQNKKLGVEDYLFFSSSVVLQIILLITCSVLLSLFCSSAFYLGFHFCYAMPCSSCIWFAEAQVEASSHVWL